jgi:site-specific DNA-methyltransferase (adenine-specific)/modification methylase
MIEPVTIGRATLYLGDCRDILPTLGKVDAVVTDPPYGILSPANSGKGSGGGKLKNRTLNTANTEWDVAPDDGLLADILAHGNDAIVWGGNYFALPPCRGVLVWDKRQPWPNFSAAELAWTTLDRPCAMFRLSSSLADKGENNAHPTVKPLELMKWCLGFLPDAQTILDPFMGSGTTGVAAVQMGRDFIGIEREPKYFDIACKRIEQAQRQGDLFLEPAA